MTIEILLGLFFVQACILMYVWKDSWIVEFKPIDYVMPIIVLTSLGPFVTIAALIDYLNSKDVI